MSTTIQPNLGYQDMLNEYVLTDSSIATLVVNGSLVLPYLSAYQVLGLDAGSNVIGQTLGNGQVLIGATGASALPASLTGSANILITPGANSISFDTVQPIQTTSNVSFGSVSTNQLILRNTGADLTISSAALASPLTYTIKDTGVPSTFIMNQSSQQIFASLAVNSLTLVNSTNQLAFGSGSTLSLISVPAPAGIRICSLPDSGTTNTSFVLADGNSTINSTKTFSGLPIFSALSNNQICYLSAGKQLISDPAITAAAGNVNATTFTAATYVGIAASSNQLVFNSGLNAAVISVASTAGTPRTYTIPNVSSNADIVLTAGTQTIGGNKTVSGTTNLSALTASLPLQLDASKNIVSALINLTSGVTGVLPIANGGSTGGNTGDVTLTTIGAVPNANGASLSGQVLNLQPANASFGGVVTTGAQTFAGNKTLSGTTNLSALTASLPLQLDASKNVVSTAISLSAGVSGQLPLANGGTSANLTASNGGIFYSTGSAGAILAGTSTANKYLTSGASSAPSWQDTDLAVNSSWTIQNVAQPGLYMLGNTSAGDGCIFTMAGWANGNNSFKIWQASTGMNTFYQTSSQTSSGFRFFFNANSVIPLTLSYPTGTATFAANIVVPTGLGGRTDGGTPSSGQIGQIVQGNTTSITTVNGSWRVSAGALYSLPNAGVWQMYTSVNVQPSTTIPTAQLAVVLSTLNTNGNNSNINGNNLSMLMYSTGSALANIYSMTHTYVATGATSIYADAFAGGGAFAPVISFNAAGGGGYGNYAVRIA